MKGKVSALYSQYIIDGTICDATPAELLDECMEFPDLSDEDSLGYEDIIDESPDRPLTPSELSLDRFDDHIEQLTSISAQERTFSMLYPAHHTRLQIAKALLSRLWSEGHFRLYNLRLWAQWDWNTRPLGNMASFYRSAEAAGEYIFGLGVKMSDYLFIENDSRCCARFFAWLPEDDCDPESDGDDAAPRSEERIIFKSPFESSAPWIGEKRRCPATILPEKSSWILYIPFDTCPFRSGGSLIEQANGRNGGNPPQIQDPDYFIDCYEVVRELVEDGIVKAGCTVADGGLAFAAARMCGEHGMDLDIDGIVSSYGESDRVAILFGETPGVLIQISDSDYDYLDSQLILQDIAYYPVGVPTDDKGLKLKSGCRSAVADILTSLMGQATEGED